MYGLNPPNRVYVYILYEVIIKNTINVSLYYEVYMTQFVLYNFN